MKQKSIAIDVLKVILSLIALALVLCLSSHTLRPWTVQIVGGSFFLGLFVFGHFAGKEVRADQQPTVSLPFPESASHVPVRTQFQATEHILERLHKIDWFQFEKLVALMYQKLGYKVTRRGGANPDGGIDLIIEKNQEQIAVQCKHWKTRLLRVKTIREFLGALTDAGLKKGVVVTISGYTGDAKQLADKHQIKILSEVDLVRMLKEVDASYDPTVLEIQSDTKKYCPKCEKEMVLRTASKGRGAGQNFWGCSAYPKCRYTLPA